MEEDKYKEIEIECELCKTKFEITVLASAYSPEMEERLRQNFYIHCPVCKTLKEMKKGLKEDQAK